MTASRGRALRFAVSGLLAATIAAGCSKETPPPGSTPPKPKTADAAPATAAPSSADAQVDAALKERLARQEAATKLFDPKKEAAVLQPPPPKASSAASPPEPPPKAAAAEPPPKPVVAEPPKAVAKAPAPPPAPTASTPPPAPPKVAAAAPPKEAAAPPPPKAAAAPPAPREPRLVARVEPEFPPEAVRAGVTNGTVKARLTLDGTGHVTQVDIVEAVPRRLFDRAVLRALSQWRFSEGDAGRTVDSEISFRR